MPKLCFGTFATVLKHCKPRRTTQKKLFGIILRSINDNYVNAENDDTISGLVCGNDNLSRDITDAMPESSAFSAVSKYFGDKVVPLLDPNKHSDIILALKDIISVDEDILPTTVVEMINSLTKENVINRDSFVFADFIAGVFLYTVSNVENKDCGEYVNEITEDYMLSFDSHKADVSFVTSYSRIDNDFSREFAAKADEIALLSTNGGNCQSCSRPLGVKNGDKYESYATRFQLAENDDIVICPDCDRRIRNSTEDEKKKLSENKQKLDIRAIAWDAVAKHKLDSEIQAVLEAIHDMDVNEGTKLKIEPVKVENKVEEKLLKSRVRNDVMQLYDGVNSVLDRLSGENRLNADRFARSVRRMYEDASDTLTSQSDIYYLLVDSIYEKCGRKHKAACEVIVSYFVQSCEVFDEIAK